MLCCNTGVQLGATSIALVYAVGVGRKRRLQKNVSHAKLRILMPNFTSESEYCDSYATLKPFILGVAQQRF